MLTALLCLVAVAVVVGSGVVTWKTLGDLDRITQQRTAGTSRG